MWVGWPPLELSQFQVKESNMAIDIFLDTCPLTDEHFLWNCWGKRRYNGYSMLQHFQVGHVIYIYMYIRQRYIHIHVLWITFYIYIYRVTPVEQLFFFSDVTFLSLWGLLQMIWRLSIRPNYSESMPPVTRTPPFLLPITTVHKDFKPGW